MAETLFDHDGLRVDSFCGPAWLGPDRRMVQMTIGREHIRMRWPQFVDLIRQLSEIAQSDGERV